MDIATTSNWTRIFVYQARLVVMLGSICVLYVAVSFGERDFSTSSYLEGFSVVKGGAYPVGLYIHNKIFSLNL